MKAFACAVASVVLTALTVRGEVLAYWDFNNSLLRSSGTQGTLGIAFDGLGVGFADYGAGTTVNLLDGFAAGESRQFNALATIAESVRVSVLNLDFTGYTSPVISLAARNDGLFGLGDEFYLEYNVGAGWVRAATFTDPDDSFGLFSHTFAPGVLDNVAGVGLRYTHATGLTALSQFAVDNLQVTAAVVPEPSTLAMGGLGLLAAGAALLRRLRRPAK